MLGPTAAGASAVVTLVEVLVTVVTVADVACGAVASGAAACATGDWASWGSTTVRGSYGRLLIRITVAPMASSSSTTTSSAADRALLRPGAEVRVVVGVVRFTLRLTG